VVHFLRDETYSGAAKIAIFQYLTVAVFVFLLAGYWDLQVRNEGLYNSKAQQNQIKSLPMPAPRGRILDRDGRVIVDNHASFRVVLSRESLREDHVEPIARGLNLDVDDFETRVRRFERRPSYFTIPVKEELTSGELAFVESHRNDLMFPEMELIKSQFRLYPKDGFASHLIGYVGEISDAELNSPEWASHNPGDLIGTLAHGDSSGTSQSIVLNNHDYRNNPPGPYTLVYDDSGAGDFVGSQSSDGPGSLNSFIGQQAIGVWMLTEADTAATATGTVQNLTMMIEPHQDIKGLGAYVTVPPQGWFIDYIDVPAGFTNLGIFATNLLPTAVPSPLQLYLNYNAQPTFSNYLESVWLTNCITGTYPAGIDPGIGGANGAHPMALAWVSRARETPDPCRLNLCAMHQPFSPDPEATTRC